MAPRKSNKSVQQNAVEFQTLDDAATAAFSRAVDRFVSANTVSKDTARRSLVDMGIIDISGKLTKNYQ